MSMLGRKTSLLEDASQVLKDFQAVSEVEPARDRAKSFSRQASTQYSSVTRVLQVLVCELMVIFIRRAMAAQEMRLERGAAPSARCRARDIWTGLKRKEERSCDDKEV